MGFKIKKTVNGETVWEPIKAKKYTSSKTIEYTGALPITINTDGNALIDYQIYGNTEQTGTPTPENPIIPSGCGERTENLLSEKYENRSINGVGAFTIDSNFDLWIGEVVAGQIYTISNMNVVYGFFTTKPMADTGVTYNRSRELEASETAVVTVPSGCTWIAIRVLHNADNAMLNLGSTPLPYEPYGYKLPMVSRGENLWNSELEQGTFDISTGEERDASERIRSDYIHIQNSDNYTITLTGAEGVVVYVYDANKSFLSAESTVEWQALPFTREIEANRYVRFAFAKSASGGYYEKITPSDVSNIMLVKGSTAPDSYIPHYREEIPIYLGEVETTRRIKKLVLTGEEEILLRVKFANATAYSYAHYTADALSYTAAPIICSHFPFLASYAAQSDHIYQDTKNFYITSTQYRTVADFKSYLAQQYANGTPVTVWYVLAEPETGIVNEPLMKIGDHADTVDNTQTSVQIPTFAGTTVIDYDGTTKPSQMYTEYNSQSRWEDIDNYKMSNENWTPEVTE